MISPPRAYRLCPAEQRSTSRLLCLDGTSGTLAHRRFNQLTERLYPGDLLVFNNTRVIPARLFGHKASGGKGGNSH